MQFAAPEAHATRVLWRERVERPSKAQPTRFADDTLVKNGVSETGRKEVIRYLFAAKESSPSQRAWQLSDRQVVQFV